MGATCRVPPTTTDSDQMDYVTPADDRGGQAQRWRPRLHEIVLAAVVVVFLVAKYRLLATINVNWDEFLYLSRVHEYARDELRTPLLTFHVHFFQWLTRLDGIEVDQVIAARQVAFVLRLGTTVLLFLLAQRLTSRSGALVAVLASLAFSYVLRHGESFRADPIIAFLFLAGVTLMVLRPERSAAVVTSGLAFAGAAAISVKMALFAPSVVAIAAILVWGATDPGHRRLRLRRMALLGAVAVAAYAIMIAAHSATVAAGPGDIGRRAAASGAGMLGNPQLWILYRTLELDWPIWILFAGGVVLAVRSAMRQRGDEQRRALLVLALQLPIATIFFYRNTYPYFYVTLVPLLSVACGYLVAGVERLVAERSALRSLVAILLAAPLVLRGWDMKGRLEADGVAMQRALLQAIHAMFPEPVPYLDRGGMVASFPHANMFMSSYTMDGYRRRGIPAMEEVVGARQPHFLVANTEALRLELQSENLAQHPHRLLPEDFAYLRENFIHHWGPVWVPGRALELRDREEVSTPIAVAGTYTVESDGPVLIDGREIRPNGLVDLDRGAHTVKAVAGTTTGVTLRLGAQLHRPAPIRIVGPLFWSL